MHDSSSSSVLRAFLCLDVGTRGVFWPLCSAQLAFPSADFHEMIFSFMPCERALLGRTRTWRNSIFQPNNYKSLRRVGSVRLRERIERRMAKWLMTAATCSRTAIGARISNSRRQSWGLVLPWETFSYLYQTEQN